MSNDRTVGGARREYERVADALRHEIEGGAIAVGARLPTHAELVDRFDVSRATVQKAIKALEGKGYVESAQGKGVFALDWRESAVATHVNGVATAAVEAGSVELDDAIAEAFEADHVTIDAYCLTAESLNAAIVPQARRILRGELEPSSIHVRLLLARPGAHLAIPRIVGDPDDTRPLDRLSELIERHAFTLRNLLEDFGRRGVEVSVEVRTLPITPVAKHYLINRDLALMGYYKVEANSVELPDGDTAEIYDVMGLGARLYPQGPEQRAECQEWFDSLWTTIAESV
ncbi:GntR family transcriptional regulator [Actinacidiphila glaucinigra]|uniref:GntR family transcriptional regulator n=1 Tax=Actinacidiphila glaucinigra TaxID=235986 RepID=UPI002DDA18B6|nr:GntR family transcriptional regulator [Actinacidiphila glaucinigra]WSD60889.1 GntR family transcriptional regulator [Actinacidiphila glaucinigra]